MKILFLLVIVAFTSLPSTLHAQGNRDIPEQMRKRLNDEKAIEADSVFRVTFNHTQTITDLLRIKTWLEVHSINLTYRKLSFDENGKLGAITFHVRDASAGGSDSAENLTDQNTVGFFYDYRKNAKYRFGAGSKNSPTLR